MIGGEGTDISKYRKWKKILLDADSPVGIASAFGLSELFSAVCTEMPSARCDENREILSVGIPYAGITVGVFDENGKEVGYNQRGELWVKSKSAMKGYYNKPKLTAQTKVNVWIHTGDFAEIDENGFVYIWGRVTDAVVFPNGQKKYLFDVANKIKERPYISDAIVLQMTLSNDKTNAVAHIVWDAGVKESDFTNYLKELNEDIKNYEPEINLCAYDFPDVMLPYSPTTLKKDKNKMSKQLDNYVQVVDEKMVNIRFRDAGNGKYVMETI